MRIGGSGPLVLWVRQLESSAGRVNPRGLRVPAFVGTRTALRAGVGWICCGVGRVVLAVGAGRARVEKFFVRVTECWAKARELNQLKNRKTRGCSLQYYSFLPALRLGQWACSDYYVMM